MSIVKYIFIKLINIKSLANMTSLLLQSLQDCFLINYCQFVEYCKLLDEINHIQNTGIVTFIPVTESFP